ncbi:MAG: sigma-54-dependent Fis family transcriptional regulator, partial [Planctomycetes bacterium]|nr:sigma-54-dependent Fis family transcriptional regulator [Planctomycetota bacterium]
MRWVIRRVFEDDEVDIAEAGNGREALALLETFAADVVLTDVAMPEMDGRELLRACRSLDQDLPVILVSALEDIDTAVGAMKEGAFDYLAKPFEIERLRATAQRAAEQHRLRREVADLRGRLLDDAVRFGSSPEAAELDRMLHLVAEQRELTVLLAGESGTGKEVAAREIHRRSPWRNGPFIAVDCGALPEHLIESQLFGHKKGA